MKAKPTAELKIQRTMYLDPALMKLVDQRHQGTGASRARIMTAAVIAYFFELSEAEQAFCMQMCMKLESGEITVAEIPATLKRKLAARNK